MLILFVAIIILLAFFFSNGKTPSQIKHRVKFCDIRQQRYIDEDGNIFDSLGKINAGTKWLNKYCGD